MKIYCLKWTIRSGWLGKTKKNINPEISFAYCFVESLDGNFKLHYLVSTIFRSAAFERCAVDHRNIELWNKTWSDILFPILHWNNKQTKEDLNAWLTTILLRFIKQCCLPTSAGAHNNTDKIFFCITPPNWWTSISDATIFKR